MKTCETNAIQISLMHLCGTVNQEFYNHHILKTKQQKNICIEDKVIIRLNFNPGLALTGFRTILPCFLNVNLT